MGNDQNREPPQQQKTPQQQNPGQQQQQGQDRKAPEGQDNQAERRDPQEKPKQDR